MPVALKYVEVLQSTAQWLGWGGGYKYVHVVKKVLKDGFIDPDFFRYQEN